MQIKIATIWIAGSLALLLGMTAPAEVASAKSNHQVVGPASTDFSTHARRQRGPTRLRVYPNYFYPGPNAVRQCEAHYEQEYRQSGTVIVPRMRCWWQRR